MYRISNNKNWPVEYVNRIISGDALAILKKIPKECIALAITSPPYWDIIDYQIDGQIGQSTYEKYLNELLLVWKETYRVLIPNGKLVIVSPIMPIPKKIMPEQHTRHIKNISNDIEYTILKNIKGLKRFSLFIWQKQTSKKMFGSYPYPPNIFEDNTIEFINVFVKDGIPPTIPIEVKKASEIIQKEWVNLTMQVWPIYPKDVKRENGHPAPFPVVLPQRLIMMYSFMESEEHGFEGDIVLDMFNGSGSTTLAAKYAKRKWIGIDINSKYCEIARRRLDREFVDPYAILLEPIKVKSPQNSRQKKLFENI